MVPAFTALAQTAARPRTRFGVVYIPNGAIVEQWIPDEVGTGFEFKPILKPLEPFKDQLVAVTNLTRSHPGQPGGRSRGERGRISHWCVAEAHRS
jgi:hypothetical protein